MNFPIELELRDWAVVISTLLGPILAVQAQKWVESIKSIKARKVRVFEQLMATRLSRLSAEHVRALNMIDIVFYGNVIWGYTWQSKKEQKVIRSWKEYLDHLNNKSNDLAHWSSVGDEFFTTLLCDIAIDVGYKFDRIDVKRGIYSPIAHGEIENDMHELRKAILSLAKGEHPLNMNVVGFPIDKDAVESNQKLTNTLNKAFNDGVLKVDVKK